MTLFDVPDGGDRLFQIHPDQALLQVWQAIEDCAAVAAFPRLYQRQPPPDSGHIAQREVFWLNLQQRVISLANAFIPVRFVPVQGDDLAIADSEWSDQDITYEGRTGTLLADAQLPGLFRRYPQKDQLAVGYCQQGDVLGPWLYDDLFRILDVLRYRKLNLGVRVTTSTGIGDARPVVPTGQSPCPFAYSYARTHWMDRYKVSQTPNPTVNFLGRSRARIGVRAGSLWDGQISIHRYNITGLYSGVRPTFYLRVGMQDLYGYQTGLPGRINPHAEVFGWGIPADELTPPVETDGESVRTVIPVVPLGFPAYTNNRWVQWSESNNLTEESGAQFMFPVNTGGVNQWPLDLAGSPCPTILDTEPNPTFTSVVAEYGVGSRPHSTQGTVRPFAILSVDYELPRAGSSTD